MTQEGRNCEHCYSLKLGEVLLPQEAVLFFFLEVRRSLGILYIGAISDHDPCNPGGMRLLND